MNDGAVRCSNTESRVIYGTFGAVWCFGIGLLRRDESKLRKFVHVDLGRFLCQGLARPTVVLSVTNWLSILFACILCPACRCSALEYYNVVMQYSIEDHFLSSRTRAGFWCRSVAHLRVFVASGVRIYCSVVGYTSKHENRALGYSVVGKADPQIRDLLEYLWEIYHTSEGTMVAQEAEM